MSAACSSNLADEAAVRQAYRSIEESVAPAVGREHFLGVTVQPMIAARRATS